MKRDHAVYILLFMCLHQYYALGRKHQRYFQNDLEDQLLKIINEDPYQIATDSDERFESRNNDPNTIDFDDYIDIDLWNELNHNDIKNMPQIDDYSSEACAIRWLKWRTRISKRYRQVLDKTNHICFDFSSRFT